MITRRMVFRAIIGALVLVAVVGSAWIFSLPNQAECRESGRVVEETVRYCLSGAESQLLEEHAIFHTVPIVLIVLFIAAAGYVVRRLIRRRPKHAAPRD